MADLPWCPEGTQWLGYRDRPMKWDDIARRQMAYCETSYKWKLWDKKHNHFIREKVTEEENDQRNGFNRVICGSCKTLTYWYDMDTYNDEWGNEHIICWDCKKAYNSVGMKLRRIDFQAMGVN
jgi:formylmethanofuran dehydrogenase subunit E